MADLPELPDPIKRKLALQWSALLDAHHFTGEQFRLHDEARARQLDRRRRIAALPGASGGSLIDESATDQETGVDDTGIGPSVALAEARFKDLSSEYWPRWSSSGDGYEIFAGWLDTIKGQVSAELALAWKGGSKFHDRWYQRACYPAVENALAVLVKDWGRRARAEELKRLEFGDKPGAVSTIPKDELLGDDLRAEDLPSPEAFEASHRAAVSKFLATANMGTVAEQRRGAAAEAPFRPLPSVRSKVVRVIDGEKVVAARAGAGLSQKSFARSTHVSLSSLKRIERNEPVSEKIARKVIKYCRDAKGEDVQKKSAQKGSVN